MTSATNRRAVMGAALAAGAIASTAGLPAAASEPQLSAVDHRVLDLWRRLTKLQAISRKLCDDREVATGAERAWLGERRH